MDPNVKKTALRMIPYGLFVLTSQTEQGKISAASVNWVTQASFEPPLVAVCVRADSFIHEVIAESQVFALNILGKDQSALAFTFFKPAVREGDRLSGQPFHPGSTGAPIFETCPAYIECKLVGSLVQGDHSVFLGQVVEAGVRAEIPGRPDQATLLLMDLGEKLFYGG
jgi:flavin reductase (DIM6/NTAB) family NADH-FMN oxidoreductase RutF